MREKAILNYSWRRFFYFFFLNLQASRFVPSSLRVIMVKLGGVKVKKNVFLGSGISFDTLRPDLITIGEGCCITSGVKIITHFLEPDKDTMYYDKVEIGSKVFIGMNSLIVNSVKIGDNSVIGAGSVVLKDIGEKEIWAGNPARFIRKRNVV